jgi:hypothetical protein
VNVEFVAALQPDGNDSDQGFPGIGVIEDPVIADPKHPIRQPVGQFLPVACVGGRLMAELTVNRVENTLLVIPLKRS